MFISVNLLTKYVIHALGSVHKKLGVSIKAVPKLLRLGLTKRMAQAFLIASDAKLFIWHLNRALVIMVVLVTPVISVILAMLVILVIPAIPVILATLVIPVILVTLAILVIPVIP